MNHVKTSKRKAVIFHKKTAFFQIRVCLFAFAHAFFTLLVRNAAGSFASALAGGLAFAAAAVFNALFQVAGLYRLNSFHFHLLLRKFYKSIVAQLRPFVNCKPAKAAVCRTRIAPKVRVLLPP
jgi:hypothetical protein